MKGMKSKIKTGDTVIVIAGKDRGVTGKVLKVLLSEYRVLVEGVNFKYNFRKPTRENPEGGIVRMEAPIHLSNVQIFDRVSNRPSKIGCRIQDGKKMRYCKVSGELV